MPDDQRVYDDKEFALVLRKAAELASRTESPSRGSAGLTLTEMKAAAAQAGLDPALVERAAQLLAANANASLFERVMGGPLQYDCMARFSTRLDENRATQLLSAVQISAGLAGARDVGHPSSMGMTWHDGGDLEALRVTARPDGDGTAVSVGLDRRGTLGVVGMVSGIAMFFVVLFSMYSLFPASPALGIGGFVIGTGSIFAAARAYWTSSTRKVQERISGTMDTIARTLALADPHASEAEAQPRDLR